MKPTAAPIREPSQNAQQDLAEMERIGAAFEDRERLAGAVGTSEDTSEGKPTLALQQGEHLLKIASRVGQIGGWNVDLVKLTVSWSDEVSAIHGMPSGYSPGLEEAIDFYAPEFRSTIQNAVGLCIAHGTPFDLELQIMTAQGRRCWVRAIGEAELDHTGKVTSIQGAFQNISERREALEALRISNERFQLVAQATSDVIWDLDIATQALWWSEGLQSQFGHPLDSSGTLQFWSDHIHPADRKQVMDGFQAALESERVWQDEYRFRKADGTYIHIADRGMIARDEDGNPYRAVGAMVDITRQRRLEVQIEQIKRVSSLGQLAANMAHEFNNVLMGIQPFVEVIRRLTPEIQKVQDATGRISQSVKRGKNITDQILRFTRKIEPTFASVNVSHWLLGFLAEAEALAGAIVTISVHPPDEPLLIEADIAQLNQVLANLVINARDASKHGDRLIIAAARGKEARHGVADPSSFVEVRVQDFGIGLDAVTLLHIFEPLFTTKRQGTGLGLAISQQVVTVHGGSIGAESTPGTGTTFHILLPLSHAVAAPLRASDEDLHPTPKTILIVEDEPAVAEGIALLLSIENVKSRVVSEGSRAVAAIEQISPDLVFLDIGLPDISGIEVFERIHDRWPDLPVVLMTGHYDRSELDSILKLPHIGFLQKPFGIVEFRKAFKLVSSVVTPEYSIMTPNE